MKIVLVNLFLGFLVKIVLKMSDSEDCQIVDFCEETLDYTYNETATGDDISSVFDQMMTAFDFDPDGE